MKIRKTVISALLCFALCLGFLPATASAATVAGGSCGDNLTWTLDDSGTMTISGTGPMTNFSLAPWEEHWDDIKQFKFPAGITYIDSDVFSYTTIDGYWVAAANEYYSSDSHGVIFNKNKTTLLAAPGTMTGTYTVPNGVTKLDDGAFAGCGNLEQILLPDSLEIIGNYAFMNCQDLTTLTIPYRVYSIGIRAFSPSYCLSSIWVDEDNLNFSHDSSGVLFNKDKTVLIAAPGAISGYYAVPDTVRVIDNAAFNCCGRLTAVTIPESVTRFEDFAFSGSGLQTISGGKGLQSIGAGALGDCRSLTDVYYDGTITQAMRIQVEAGNDSLANATIHFRASVPGDMDGDGDRDTEDAVYLLLNVLFGDEKYPLAV